MDNEKLNEILTNSETTIDQKQQAIKDMISSGFVSRSDYNKRNDERKQAEETLFNVQKQFDDFKASKMTEEEKEKEKIELERQRFIEMSNKLSTSEARRILEGSGLKEEEYKEILPSLIQSTPEATIKVAEGVANMLKAQKSNLENQFKSSVMKQTPKPEGGDLNDKPDTTYQDLEQQFYNSTNDAERASIMTKMNEMKFNK